MDFPADMRRFGGMRRPIALRDGLREKLCLWAGKLSRRGVFRRMCGGLVGMRRPIVLRDGLREVFCGCLRLRQ